MSAWNSDPVVITCAITGADVFRENNPNIPYTTQEIADSAIGASEAGAAISHLHVREDDGTPSGRPELFVDVIDRIRAGAPDMLTMVSTGGANEHDDRAADHRPRGQAGHLGRRVGLDELRRRDLHHAAAGRARASSPAAREMGIALEVEVFDVGHVVSAVRWLEEGILEAPMRINLVFGVPGGIDATPGGARRDAAPAAARDVLDRHLHRPPPPAHARASRCSRARPASAPASRTSPTSAAACTRPRTRPWSRWPSSSAARSAARSPRRRRPGSCWGLSEADTFAAVAAARSAVGDTAPRRGPETRAAIDARRDRALRPARLPRDLDAGDRGRRRGAAGCDLSLVPEQGGDPRSASRTTSWTGSPSASRLRSRRTTGRRCGSPAAIREHVVFHGEHTQEAFVTDSEIRALAAEPRAALIAQRDAYQERFGRADPRRHPRRLPAQLRCQGRHLLDPPAVHGRRPLVPTRRARSGSSRWPRSTSSSCSDRSAPSAS